MWVTNSFVYKRYFNLASSFTEDTIEKLFDLPDIERSNKDSKKSLMSDSINTR